MRRPILLLLLGVAVTVMPPCAPAAAAPMAAEPADDLALDVARVYLDPAIYGQAFRTGFLGEIDICQSAGKLSAKEAAQKRVIITDYVDAVVAGFGQVHAAMAGALRPAFTARELSEVDAFLRSKAGRNMLGITVNAVVIPMTARYSPCQLKGPVPSLADSIDKAMAAIPADDMDVIGRFGLSPAGKKFLAFGPQLNDAMRDSLTAIVAEALQRSGIGQDFTA